MKGGTAAPWVSATLVLALGKLALGAAVSVPLLGTVAALLPPGLDAELAAPGGAELFDLLRADPRVLWGAVQSSGLLGLALGVLGLLPLAGALELLTHPGRSPLSLRLAQAARHWPALIVAAALFGLLQLLIAFLGMALVTPLWSPLQRGLGPTVGPWVGGLLVALVLLLLALSGVAHDLARCLIVQRRWGGLAASSGAAEALKGRWLPLFGQWAPRAAVGFLGLAGAQLGWLAAAPPHERHLALGLAWAVQLAGLLWYCAWRVSWLGAALERLRADADRALSSEGSSAPADRAARTDARDDPSSDRGASRVDGA